MAIDWSKIIPVLVSIGILIAVAILRQYSRTLAAVAAAMPINIPLAMWVISAGDDNKHTQLAEFNEAMVINIVPTLIFIVIAWLMTRSGQSLLPTLVVSYAVWAVSMLVVFVLRGQIHL